MEKGEAAVRLSGFRWLLHTTGPNPKPHGTPPRSRGRGVCDGEGWLEGLSRLLGGLLLIQGHQECSWPHALAEHGAEVGDAGAMRCEAPLPSAWLFMGWEVEWEIIVFS